MLLSISLAASHYEDTYDRSSADMNKMQSRLYALTELCGRRHTIYFYERSVVVCVNSSFGVIEHRIVVEQIMR